MTEPYISARPHVGHFWFVAEDTPRHLDCKPSQLVGWFEPLETSSPGSGGRVSKSAVWPDEVWPFARSLFPFIGMRRDPYYPGGSVSWRHDDQSALIDLDASITAPPFLEHIAAYFGVDVAKATISVRPAGSRKARVGLPEQKVDPRLRARREETPWEEDGPAPTEVIEDRAYGALLGLAIGDALGATLEFQRRDTQPRLTEMVGGGPFGLKAGEWTDDTSMALCLADSLIANGKLDHRDLLARFVRWWRHGENSVTGSCFDIGITTREALARFERIGSGAESGPCDSTKAGNGSLMRMAPVAIFAAPDVSLAIQLAEWQSQTTHPALEAHAACQFFAILLVTAISGGDKHAVLESRFWPGVHEVAAGNWRAKKRDDISSSGYVVSTLEAALWCIYQTENFEDAVVMAVNLGDDADTVGAVCGQLAGAIYGRSGIPARWLEKLAWREKLEERAAALLEAGKRSCAR